MCGRFCRGFGAWHDSESAYGIHHHRMNCLVVWVCFVAGTNQVAACIGIVS